MPVIIKYICDGCNKEQPNRGSLYTLRLIANQGPEEASLYIARNVLNALWCKDCMDKHWPQLSWAPKETTETQPTFENVLKQLIAEEVSTQLDNAK